MKPFVIERVLNAPVEKVWKAITDKNDMKQWYFDLPDFRAEVGFEFQFEGGNEDRVYTHLCKVTEVIPRRKLTYSWRYKGYEGNSFVTFELFAEGSGTKIRLTHAGLETFPPIDDFAKENFAAGWTEIIGSSLLNFFERVTLKKTVLIEASPAMVWKTLLGPESLKQWASAFSEGTYAETDWKMGSPVLWKDKEGNVGAKGIVVVSNPPTLLKVDFFDEAAAGQATSPGEYSETYILQPVENKTKMTTYSGPLTVNDSKMHSPLWDKAMLIMKKMAEA